MKPPTLVAQDVGKLSSQLADGQSAGPQRTQEETLLPREPLRPDDRSVQLGPQALTRGCAWMGDRSRSCGVTVLLTFGPRADFPSDRESGARWCGAVGAGCFAPAFRMVPLYVAFTGSGIAIGRLLLSPDAASDALDQYRDQ